MYRTDRGCALRSCRPVLYMHSLLRIQGCIASSIMSSLFADDTELMSSGPDLAELTNFVNTEFQKCAQFFRTHKLALHPSKTQFLLFTSSLAARENPPLLYINNNDLGGSQDPQKLIAIPNVNNSSELPAVKFLGIYLDPLLNFKCAD